MTIEARTCQCGQDLCDVSHVPSSKGLREVQGCPGPPRLPSSTLALPAPKWVTASPQKPPSPQHRPSLLVLSHPQGLLRFKTSLWPMAWAWKPSHLGPEPGFSLLLHKQPGEGSPSAPSEENRDHQRGAEASVTVTTVPPTSPPSGTHTSSPA